MRFLKIRIILIQILILTVLWLVAGCSKNLRHLQNVDEFEEQVLLADKPVLVEFYKGGCPTCLGLEAGLNKLSKEYEGRVEFARFELMPPIFVVTSQELKDNYDVSFFPTVLLFDHAEVQGRWVMEYGLNSYRQALNQVALPDSSPTPIHPIPASTECRVRV